MSSTSGLEEAYYALDAKKSGAVNRTEPDFDDEAYMSGLFSDSNIQKLVSRGLVDVKKAESEKGKIRNQIEEAFYIGDDPDNIAEFIGNGTLYADFDAAGLIVTLYQYWVETIDDESGYGSVSIRHYGIIGAAVTDENGKVTFNSVALDPRVFYIFKWADPEKRVADQYSNGAYPNGMIIGNVYTLDGAVGIAVLLDKRNFFIECEPTKTLTGHVYKFGTFKPISGIKINLIYTYKNKSDADGNYDGLLRPMGSDIITDESGYFEFTGIPAGEYVLKSTDTMPDSRLAVYKPNYSYAGQLISESESFALVGSSTRQNLFLVVDYIKNIKK